MRFFPKLSLSSAVTKDEFLEALAQVPIGAPLDIDIQRLDRGVVEVHMSTVGKGRPGGTVNGPTLFALADLITGYFIFVHYITMYLVLPFSR